MARPKKKKENEMVVEEKNIQPPLNEPKKFEQLTDEELNIVIEFERKTAPVFGKAGSSITMEKVKKKYGGAIFPLHQIPTMKRVIENW